MTEFVEVYFTEEELKKLYINSDKKLLKEKGYKLNGKKEGEWIEGYFDDWDKYFYKKINYINNIKQGECIEYYKDGKIYKQYYYINNLKAMQLANLEYFFFE
jgi:antitoxin component YwqK of YwqJK toxin-antitoxin module